MTPTEKPRQRFIPLEDDRLEYRLLPSILPETEANHKQAVDEIFAEEQLEQQREAARQRDRNRRGMLPRRR